MKCDQEFNYNFLYLQDKETPVPAPDSPERGPQIY